MTKAAPIPKPEWVRRFAAALCHRVRGVGTNAATTIATEAYELGTLPEAAARAYVPGSLTVRLHNWPPGFEPQGAVDPGALKRQEAAVRGRATQLANGHTGSIRNGLSKKSVSVMPNARKAVIA